MEKCAEDGHTIIQLLSIGFLWLLASKHVREAHSTDEDYQASPKGGPEPVFSLPAQHALSASY